MLVLQGCCASRQNVTGLQCRNQEESPRLVKHPQLGARLGREFGEMLQGAHRVGMWRASSAVTAEGSTSLRYE